MMTMFLKKFDNTNTIKTMNARLFRYSLASNYMGEYVTYSSMHFFSILSGCLTLMLDGGEVTFNKDEFLILPSYSAMYMRAAEKTLFLAYEISDTLIKDVYDHNDESLNFSSAISNPLPFYKQAFDKTLLDAVNHVYDSSYINQEDGYLIDLCIRRLIYHLFKTEAGAHILSIKAKHPMEQVAYYLKRKVKDSVPISEVAKHFNMSESNLSHSFKNHYGESPRQYLNNYKLELAAEMLKENSVTDVAYEFGYENISNFIASFKNKYNTTPKQYQLLNKRIKH